MALGKGFGFSLRPSWLRGAVGSSAHLFPPGGAGPSICVAAERPAVQAVPSPTNTARTRPLFLSGLFPGEEMVPSPALLASPGGAEKLISARANCKALAVLKKDTLVQIRDQNLEPL